MALSKQSMTSSWLHDFQSILPASMNLPYSNSFSPWNLPLNLESTSQAILDEAFPETLQEGFSLCV